MGALSVSAAKIRGRTVVTKGSQAVLSGVVPDSYSVLGNHTR